MPQDALPDFEIKNKDTSPNIAIQASYSDGTVANLVGAAGTFALWKRSPLGVTTISINDKAASIVNTGSTGGILYNWAGSSETATTGDYYGEFHVTLASGKKVTFPNDGYLYILINKRVST